MTDTVTRTATRATGGVRKGAGGAGSRVAGEVARKAMSDAGTKVLGTVVDMAIARVDRVANRLDDFAESGGTGLREALTGKPKQKKKPRATGTAMPARMGAAFSLVVARAMALLQLLQRLALQLLEALQRLAGRLRTGPAKKQTADAEDARPEAANENGGPRKRPESRGERRPRTQRRTRPDAQAERARPRPRRRPAAPGGNA
ncbi:hypothetical protein [Pseudonocardia alaniniphila]|uniref:Uncharacterized protein n=1 Tax=Pseudonocardia alaniniphila TaxID=75291 RepID=A0ABS9TSN8_9PSEU|nr:hypothetical protein [Pseudonocardia alaniniphila]MCH6171383.1 hypothetical protein [Pseudonocardia alaniniphila]